MAKRYSIVTTARIRRARYVIEMPDGEDDPILLADYVTTNEVMPLTEFDISEDVVDIRSATRDEIIKQFHTDSKNEGHRDTTHYADDVVMIPVFVPPTDDYEPHPTGDAIDESLRNIANKTLNDSNGE